MKIVCIYSDKFTITGFRFCTQLKKMLSLYHAKKLYHPAIVAAFSTEATSSSTSTDELLSNHFIPPPLSPWPKKLHTNRLISIINSQPLDLAFRAFDYAGKFHPGFNHTDQTYAALITRLGRARHFDRAETLLSQMQTSGIICYGEGMFISLMRNYGMAHRPKDALKTFLRMVDFRVERTVRSLNCLLSVLVKNKQYDLVYVLFKSYKKKFCFMPNVITCNILVQALCGKGDIDGALKVLDEMPALGVVPDLVTYTTLLGAYVRGSDLETAKRFFEQILDKGLAPDVTTYTIMIDGYCKKGRLDDAVKTMDEMEENGVRPNGVTYSVIIEAYCKERKSGEAVNLIIDMLNQDHVPDLTLSCKVIDTLCHEEKVEDACTLWEKLLNKNVCPDAAISCTLIHWLCKKGKVWEAKKLFGDVEGGSIPNLITYNELIAVMCEAGELSEAVRLLDDMCGKKCIPNSFTYDILIKGFCVADNPKEGLRLFEEMLGKGCLPNESIYSLLIERLTSLGLETEIDRLLSVIVNMGGRIDSKSWEVILTKVAGNLDVNPILDSIIFDNVA